MELYFGYILAGIFFISTIFLLTKSKKNSDDNSNTLNTKIDELSLLITEKNNEIQTLSDEVKTNVVKIGVLENELKVSVEESLSTADSIKLLEDKLLKLSEELKYKESELVTLNDKIKEKVNENTSLIASQKELIEELKTKENDNSLSATYEKQISELNDKVHSSSNIELELRELLNNANSEAQSKEERISELSDLLKNKSDDLQKSIIQIDVLKDEINALNSATKDKSETNIPNEQNSKIKNILIVDDSIVIRTKLNSFLKNNGFVVTQANDGSEALNLIKQEPHKFSMVITDLEMPTLNGYELIEKISSDAELTGLPVFALTGHDQITIDVDKSNSFCGISKKPWVDNTLLNKINELSR